jgi:hypothetical protein
MSSGAPAFSVRPLTVKLAATHEKIALGVGTDVFALLIDQF